MAAINVITESTNIVNMGRDFKRSRWYGTGPAVREPVLDILIIHRDRIAIVSYFEMIEYCHEHAVQRCYIRRDLFSRSLDEVLHRHDIRDMKGKHPFEHIEITDTGKGHVPGISGTPLIRLAIVVDHEVHVVVIHNNPFGAIEKIKGAGNPLSILTGISIRFQVFASFFQEARVFDCLLYLYHLDSVF